MIQFQDLIIFLSSLGRQVLDMRGCTSQFLFQIGDFSLLIV